MTEINTNDIKFNNTRIIVAKLINGEEIIALQNKASQLLTYVVKTIVSVDEKDPIKAKLSIHPYMVSTPFYAGMDYNRANMYLSKTYELDDNACKTNATLQGYINYVSEYSVEEK